jgi:hypothetical protein
VKEGATPDMLQSGLVGFEVAVLRRDASRIQR